LDAFLGDVGTDAGGTYFFGDRPRSIDAACFGVTAIAMNENLGLQSLVRRECAYLPDFYERVRLEYFDGWPKTTNALVGDSPYRPALAGPRVPLSTPETVSEMFDEIDIAADPEALEFNENSVFWLRYVGACLSSVFLTKIASPDRSVAYGLLATTVAAAYFRPSSS